MLFYAFLLIFGVVAASDDLNCTVATASGVVLTPAAVACLDQTTLTVCQQLFGGTSPDLPAAAGMLVKDRAKGCYTTNRGVTLSDEVKQAAIRSCPNYCGFCCITPEYNCKNSPTARIDCSQISVTMCQSNQWRDVVAQDCPGACGFCLMGGCIDAAPECSKQPTICSNSALDSFTSQNCRRTCGLCTGIQLTGSTLAPGFCGDTGPHCSTWIAQGFCTNGFYTQAQKMQYCGNSCGLC